MPQLLESRRPPAAGASAEAWRQTCREVDEQAKRLADDFIMNALGMIGMSPAGA